MIRLSISIQHHPNRKHLLQNFSGLGDIDVVTDPDPDSRQRNPWRTYRQCLLRVPGYATHRMVLQDDVQVCPGFLNVATKAVEARQDNLICFFVPVTLRRGGRRLMQACQNDEPFCELMNEDNFVPVCALSWPVGMAAEFIRWADENRYDERSHRADDAIVAQFARVHKIGVLATVPSLVEHPDEEPSLVMNRAGMRRARCYVGDDAHLIDWTA